MAPGGNRLLTIGAAAGSLALLAAVALMLWPADPTDYAVASGRDRADGETVGWVSRVESNTIHVNSGPFGGGVLPLVVTKNTKITVGAKEGWFEDIRPGGQVKVTYEVYRGRRLARSVELLVDEGSRRPVRTGPRLKSTVGTPAATERAPAKASITGSPGPNARPGPPPRAAEPLPATPSIAAPNPAPRPAAAVAKPAPLPEVRPVPRPEPVPVKPQPAEIIPPPERASIRTPTPGAAAPENGSHTPEPGRMVEPSRPAGPAVPRRAQPPRGTEGGETTDGSAAVDWLLKGRR